MQRMQQQPQSQPYRRPIFSIQSALVGIPHEFRKATIIRLQSLRWILLQRAGLQLRDDSKLAWNFITQNLSPEWDLLHVADELILTHYLHNHTNYGNTAKSVIPIVKSTIEQQLGVPKSVYGHQSNRVHSKAVWEYMQRLVIPLYKIHAMEEAHPDGNFPVWGLPKSETDAAEDADADIDTEIIETLNHNETDTETEEDAYSIEDTEIETIEHDPSEADDENENEEEAEGETEIEADAKAESEDETETEDETEIETEDHNDPGPGTSPSESEDEAEEDTDSSFEFKSSSECLLGDRFSFFD